MLIRYRCQSKTPKRNVENIFSSGGSFQRKAWRRAAPLSCREWDRNIQHCGHRDVAACTSIPLDRVLRRGHEPLPPSSTVDSTDRRTKGGKKWDQREIRQ